MILVFGRIKSKKFQKTLFWGLWGLLAAFSGCAPTYTGSYTPPYYGAQPGVTTVPPSWYNYDPIMEKWYTPPYFNPYMNN